jgi:hypothetical protein
MKVSNVKEIMKRPSYLYLGLGLGHLLHLDIAGL